MRLFLLLTAAAGIGLTDARPSAASYDGPWCLRGERGGGAMVDDCQYASFAVCRHFLYLYGPTSSCIPNTMYPSYVDYRPRKKRKF